MPTKRHILHAKSMESSRYFGLPVAGSGLVIFKNFVLIFVKEFFLLLSFFFVFLYFSLDRLSVLISSFRLCHFVRRWKFCFWFCEKDSLFFSYFCFWFCEKDSLFFSYFCFSLFFSRRVVRPYFLILSLSLCTKNRFFLFFLYWFLMNVILSWFFSYENFWILFSQP